VRSQALTKDEAKVIAGRGLGDPSWFCKFFLPHWFPEEIPWVHMGLLAILTRKTNFLLRYEHLDTIVREFQQPLDPRDPKSETFPIFVVERDFDGRPLKVCLQISRYTLVMMPRGFSKTTIMNATTLMDVVYANKKFVVYTSETATHANMQLAAIKGELESNERIVAVFGQLKPDQRTGSKWSEDLFETTTGVACAARGRGAQIRGLLHKGSRPDSIKPDDVEDKESVRTEEQRQKTKVWFYSDLMPALPEQDKHATITAFGTLLHSEALLMTLADDPEWTFVRFAADSLGQALWPFKMDLEVLKRKKTSYALAGLLNEFYLEYFNLLRNEDSQKFKQRYIIYMPVEGQLHRAMCIDPAISDKKEGDFCAFAVAGMSENGLIYVLETAGKVGMTPREQIDKYFELYKRWRPDQCGVESVAYQAALVHLLREEMFRNDCYFEPIPIIHSTKVKKTERVEGILQPRYAAGYIRHTRKFPELESQLLDWPNGKKDFPDVLAMTVGLLDPYAAQAADPEVDLAADEYKDLDDVFDGDWRGAV
jgi:hypothetical protein